MRSGLWMLALLSLVTLVACGGKTPEDRAHPEGPSALASGAKVSVVEVAIDRADVPPNGVDALDRYGIPQKVRDGVNQGLRAHGASDETGELTLYVEIDYFRLRSGANAFWLGFMGGVDSIKASVDVRRGEEVVKIYATDTSTGLGGIIYASPTKRSDRLVKTLAERIVAGL